MPPSHARLAALVLALALALPAAASAAPSPRIAAVGASLREGGFYAGPAQRGTPIQLASFHLGASADLLGRRTLRLHAHGWAVRELQLALAWQGFPSGTIDGRFGPRLARAVRRFQHSHRLRADAIAGGGTIARLRSAPSRPGIPLGWPLLAPVGDSFGPRGDRFHAGIDLPAPMGAPVTAAAPGLVTWAGPRAGGWGNLVTIRHPGAVRTMYAHLSAIDVRVGDWIAGGTLIGLVGATGDATGPHLHFEVHVRGAAIDPLRALVPLAPGS